MLSSQAYGNTRTGKYIITDISRRLTDDVSPDINLGHRILRHDNTTGVIVNEVIWTLIQQICEEK